MESAYNAADKLLLAILIPLAIILNHALIMVALLYVLRSRLSRDRREQVYVLHSSEEVPYVGQPQQDADVVRRRGGSGG